MAERITVSRWGKLHNAYDTCSESPNTFQYAPSKGSRPRTESYVTWGNTRSSKSSVLAVAPADGASVSASTPILARLRNGWGKLQFAPAASNAPLYCQCR